MHRIQYISLKLDDVSKSALMKVVKALWGNAYPSMFCDHITLAYGDAEVLKFDSDLFGSKFVFQCGSIIFDNKAAAVPIDREELVGLDINNEYPHITLATKPGVRPVYSNELIRGYYSEMNDAEFIPLEEPVDLAGVVTPIYKSTPLNESEYFNPSGPVCFYHGGWHDMSGSAIDIDPADEAAILRDMSEMEQVNYASMPGYIMLDGYETVEDLADDYLECDVDDMFVYFSGTDSGAGNVINKSVSDVSPISQTNEYADSLYVLASLNDLGDFTEDSDFGSMNVRIAELADMNGHLTRKTIGVFKIFADWLKSSGSIGFYCDARAGTSNRLIESPAGKRMLDRFGYVDVSHLLEKEDDEMIPHLFVDRSWYESLDD